MTRVFSLPAPLQAAVLACSALLALSFATPGIAQAQDDDTTAEFVSQFRENIDQARIILHNIDKERRAAKRLRRKREALERVSRAFIILQRISAKAQEEEDLGEARRYMDTNLKELAADPQIKKAADNILAKAVQMYRANKLSEALGLFEELRLMDPANPGVMFLVRHIGNKLDEEEE